MLGLTAATLAQNVPNYVPTNGLIGWWPFNGNANDESGNGNNGTVNGATLASDRNGQINKAYSFNGVPNRIEIGTSINPSTQIGSHNSSWSACAWINKNQYGGTLALSDYNSIAGNTNPGENDMTLALNLQVYQNYANVGLRSNGIDYNVSGGNISNSQWHHIAFTANNGVLILFVDGNNVGQTNYNSNYNFYESPFYRIGSSMWNGNYGPSTGFIDDIGIWNRALTQQEITYLYNTVSCANNTTITPQTNSLQTLSTATFNATTSDNNPSYLWQSDFGQGYVTLNNFGNYSGTNTATLNLSNVQLSNHNLPIRVITTSGNCIDTSNVAVISIVDTCINTITDTTFITVTDTLLINTNLTGVNPPNNVNTIKIFPNPANDHITINYGNFTVMNGYQLKIENAIGQQVFQTNIMQQSDYLNLTTWGGNGLYFVHIINPQGNTIDIRKIVLQ